MGSFAGHHLLNLIRFLQHEFLLERIVYFWVDDESRKFEKGQLDGRKKLKDKAIGWSFGPFHSFEFKLFGALFHLCFVIIILTQ